MNKARTTYYSDCVADNSSNQRKLFNITKSLLNMTKSHLVVPPRIDNHDFVNGLGDFFEQKVVKIHCDIESVSHEVDISFNHSFDRSCSSCNSHKLANFTLLSQSDVRNLVLNLSKKSCSLDPMPTRLVVECLDTLLPVLTKIINLSLQTGKFHSGWKLALVRPVPKKPNAEMTFSNFRPISNLSYVSKLVEGAATAQIQELLLRNNLFPITQSAYRKYHSTETALLRVKNDLLMAMDQQKVTFLVLLNLSAAFDTVDHRILAEILRSDFGITDSVLSWLQSYLCDREQQISIGDVISKKFDVKWGVPQGSRLGPLLFSLYSSRLFAIIKAYSQNISCHCYADDTQLYISFSPIGEQERSCVSALEQCLRDLRKWMLSCKLKLNDSKTEFLIIGTPRQVSKLNINRITVGSTVVKQSMVAKNLGVWFDSQLNMDTHISKSCKAAFYHLYNLRHIRKYLTRTCISTLVHAFITSKLDYCNGLLFGLPESQICKLQRVQNACARLICNSPRFSHVNPLLHDLHWLPVRKRITFKLLLLTFKALHGLAPTYLSELLTLKSPAQSYTLRSSHDTMLLSLPTRKTKATLGDRAFVSAASKLWNSLPPSIRHASSVNLFKKYLKTFLLKERFP